MQKGIITFMPQFHSGYYSVAAFMIKARATMTHQLAMPLSQIDCLSARCHPRISELTIRIVYVTLANFGTVQ